MSKQTTHPTRLQAEIPSDLYERVVALAQKSGLSKAKTVALLIERGLEKEGEK